LSRAKAFVVSSWLRRFHRWVSITFTATVIANFVARAATRVRPPSCDGRFGLPTLAAVALSACALTPAVAQAPSPHLPGFPADLVWRNTPSDWNIAQDGTLTITAGKGTDRFAWPGGGSTQDASPWLLFKASDDFMLSTKVAIDAPSPYDAGCLVLNATISDWAKFCLEMQNDKHPAVISVVTRTLSDDVTSFSIKGKSAWLKLARVDQVIFFYASEDGRNWTIIRKFHLDAPDGLCAGFSAQSPNGDGATARFSNFHYLAERIDMWKLN
jgi:uncharacterized protein